MNSTFKDEDVKILLKIVNEDAMLDHHKSNLVKHYCDYIPDEDNLPIEYLELFDELLNFTSKQMSIYVGILSRKILSQYKNVVIVSLLRAGTVIGALIKKYFSVVLNQQIPHYSIGMSRGKGLDFNALNYIRKNNPNSTIIFVDGWIGKGTTRLELNKSLNIFNKKYKENIKPIFAVINDINKFSDLCATYDDILIPSALLNAQGCGLISRITQNYDFISEDDYNGAIIFERLRNQDKTNHIINSISKYFGYCEDEILTNSYISNTSRVDVTYLLEKYKIHNTNGLKVGINETIRILLKKKIDFVVLKNSEENIIKPIIYLCAFNNIPIKIDKDLPCNAIGINLNSKGDE